MTGLPTLHKQLWADIATATVCGQPQSWAPWRSSIFRNFSASGPTSREPASTRSRKSSANYCASSTASARCSATPPLRTDPRSQESGAKSWRATCVNSCSKSQLALAQCNDVECVVGGRLLAVCRRGRVPSNNGGHLSHVLHVHVVASPVSFPTGEPSKKRTPSVRT